jgi:hypothetical protein
LGSSGGKGTADEEGEAPAGHRPADELSGTEAGGFIPLMERPFNLPPPFFDFFLRIPAPC